MFVVEACQEAQRPGLRINVPEQPVRLNFTITPKPYFRWKSVPDRVLAALLLVPTLPVIGLLVVVVRLTSRGPGIYKQVRAGLNGRPFTMLKIRSMSCDAEAGTGAVWTRKHDPRVTRVGKVLRKLHLDEFPQLFNVLRGEMALIGPRPERPEFVEVLEEAVPGYINRLTVRPGIAGLAQINLPPDSDLHSVQKKLALDLTYIEEASLWLDMRMLLCTSVRVLGFPGNFVMYLFAVHRKCDVGDQTGEQANTDNSQGSDDVMTPEKILRARAQAGHHNGNGNGNGKPPFLNQSPKIHKPR